MLERKSETSALDAVVKEAGAGKAGAVFVLGEAGLGKTALLELVVSEAANRGFEIARGQGEAAEVALPFGYISQLFPEGADDVPGFVANLPPGERAAVAWQRLRAWALKARAGPLLLALDDLQWADRDSLTLVRLLARDRGLSRLAVVGCLRPWPSETVSMVEALAASGRATALRLSPLSSAASLRLVTSIAGEAASHELEPRLDELCAGNPLLLHELSSHAASSPSGSPSGGDSRGLLLARFTGLDEAGLRYARAAAVSGVQFRSSVAGKVAGLEEMTALAALEALCRAGLVRSVEPGRAAFTHALLRQALYDDLPGPVRGELHAATFRQLARESAPAGEVAAHALAAHLRTRPAIRALADAGSEAFRRGALHAAVGWLRAATELGGDGCPASVQLSLAEALDGAGTPDQAAEACQALLDGHHDLDPGLAARTERLLGRALFEMGLGDDAEEAFERSAALAARTDPKLAIEVLLEASLVSLYGSGVRRSFLFADRAERLLAPSTDRQLAAWVRVARGHARSLMTEPGGVEEVQSAIAALPPGTGLRGLHGAASWGPRLIQLQTAKQAERFEEAINAYELAMEEAKHSPVTLSASIYMVAHADTMARLGRISESRDILLTADDDAPWLAARRPWVHVGLAYTSYLFSDDAKARYYCERVEAAIGADRDTLPLLRFWLWYVRCGLYVEAGDTRAATDLAGRAERASEAAGVIEPCFPWHSAAIQAYLAAGRPGDAERCVERLEHLCTRVPCRWPRTVAARGRAQLSDLAGEREAARHWFEQALAWQQDLPMPLVKVETLTSYGAFLRRGREASKARQVLGEAARLAADCGATRLQRAATEELHLAGGRRRTGPSRSVARGGALDAGPRPGAGLGADHGDHGDSWASRLTPAQHRVAVLASRGFTNKEIAGRLHISEKTVEHHLGSVYVALGVSGRRRLREPRAEEEARD